MAETLRSGNITTKLQRIAELASKDRTRIFTSVAHAIDLEWMKEACRRTRKDGAAGVDGQQWADYAANLEANLSDLAAKIRAGTYRPPPVRRAHIPKANGDTRPIGIPTIEDKIAQRAVAMLLEAIYEQDFMPCSYGFRPGRSAHHALEELQRRPTYWQRCWVIEADIRSFFDTIDHAVMRSVLDQRVRDGVIRVLIDRWLNAGVLERGQVSRSDEGTPQGGVISPLLANILLHEVLDRWVERDVQPRLQGPVRVVRYADDFVLLLQVESDALRVMATLPKRFGRFKLQLHPEKTRVLSFDSPRLSRKRAQRARSFDFLGFTHYWARSRKGRWLVKQRTAKSRFSRGLRAIKERCRRMRHHRICEQHEALSRILRGHFGYYGITGNGDALWSFRHWTERIWGRSLARRNKRRFAWQRFKVLLKRFPLPPAYAIHSVAPSEPAT
jgi:RNA-directed DNA polymerase